MASRHPKMQIVAWNGIVTMHQAAWGDEAGSTVTFKLPMNTIVGGDHTEQRNPFHAFTKRRKGHAGTRFFMAVSTAESAPKPLYKDESMLAGWNDSQLHGHTVKFWLCNDNMGHPFEGIGRKQELALALSELDNDNEPIDQKMRDKVEQQSIHPTERTSYAAAMLCKNPAFWQWCRVNGEVEGTSVVDEESAVQWIYFMCQIRTRAALDDPDCPTTGKFDEIRKAFFASEQVLF